MFEIQGRNEVTRVNHDQLTTSLQQLILKALSHAFRVLEEEIGNKSSSKPGEGQFASEGKLSAQIKGTRIARNSLSLFKILPALKTGSLLKKKKTLLVVFQEWPFLPLPGIKGSRGLRA